MIMGLEDIVVAAAAAAGDVVGGIGIEYALGSFAGSG